MARASLVRARRRVRSCVLDSLVHLQQCNLTVILDSLVHLQQCNLTVKRKKMQQCNLTVKRKKEKTSLFGSIVGHCYVRLKGWHNCAVVNILTLKEKPNALHALNLCAYKN